MEEQRKLLKDAADKKYGDMSVRSFYTAAQIESVAVRQHIKSLFKAEAEGDPA